MVRLCLTLQKKFGGGGGGLAPGSLPMQLVYET